MLVRNMLIYRIRNLCRIYNTVIHSTLTSIWKFNSEVSKNSYCFYRCYFFIVLLIIFVISLLSLISFFIATDTMRMVRWIYGVKLQDRVLSKGLRERLELDDLISVLQQNRLRWYGHVLRKEDNDWVKKCMEYEVEGARPRGIPKKILREIVDKDCQARKLNREDATDRNRWRKQIRDD